MSKRSMTSLLAAGLLALVLALGMAVPALAGDAESAEGTAEAEVASVAEDAGVTAEAAEAVEVEPAAEAGGVAATDASVEAEASDASADAPEEASEDPVLSVDEEGESESGSGDTSTGGTDLTGQVVIKLTDITRTSNGVATSIKDGTFPYDNSNNMHVELSWDLSSVSDVKAGDYFTFTLPSGLKPNDASFSLGELGTATIAKVGDSYVVTATMGAGVSDVEQVNGTMSISVASAFTKGETGSEKSFYVTYGDKVTSTINATPVVTTLGNEYINKWGYVNSDGTAIDWVLRINHNGSALTNAVITDTINSDDPAIYFIPGSFSLEQVEYDASGAYVRTIAAIDLSSRLTISEDGKTYTIDLRGIDTSGKQYRVKYQTTVIDQIGYGVSNSATITSDQFPDGNSRSRTTYVQGSSGTATGDLRGRIQIVKVDSDGVTYLPGAVFQVSGPSGTFELTTGEDGRATSEVLLSGEYTIQEITAPEGYELDDTVYTVTVSSDSVALQVITNEKSAEDPEDPADEDDSDKDGTTTSQTTTTTTHRVVKKRTALPQTGDAASIAAVVAAASGAVALVASRKVKRH